MKIINIYKQSIIKKACFFFIILISSPIYANVVLNELTQLNSNDINVNWEKATSHPAKKNHFYVYNYQGIFTEIVNGKTPETHILDLSKAISQPNINLTAIAIHPNFHLKDLPGYQIFYTAHQEPINTESGKTRLPEVPIKDSKYDLVINEWRLNSETLTADLTSQREIIRIASPEQKNTIQKIAFNPNLKPWQDGFSSLYIVLNHTQEYSEIPLYSGAILRITPEEFGLKNYIIPEKNPFKINKNIPNEIIAFGINNVTDLLWDKTSNEQWFYLETIATETLLKKVKKGIHLNLKKVMCYGIINMLINNTQSFGMKAKN